MDKKVMVAIPTTDYVHINFALALAALVLRSKIPTSVQVAGGSSICQNRNTLVYEAQKIGADFILFIDNDLSFPPFAAERLVHIAEERGLDIIGCNYLFKSPPHKWMVKPKPGREQLEAIEEVDGLPCGMLLIRMSVFDKLEQPYFNYNAHTIKEGPQEGLATVGSEDYYFCDRARDQGFKIWLDTDMSFGLVHWGSPIGVRWIAEDPGYQYMQEPLRYSESAPGPESEGAS
jgi:glycosyltransferase involved in cell wall biosynthesis